MTSASGAMNSLAHPARRRRTSVWVPCRGGDELLQLLVIDPEPLGHRLHRLAFAVQHQPTQIQLPFRPLITPREPAEHPPGELFDHRADLVHLLRKHPKSRSQQDPDQR